MRRRLGSSLRIGVSPGALGLVAVNRFQRGQVAVLAEQRLADGAFETIGAGLRALLQDAGCAGWPASVVVADELARFWQVTPPPGAARMADLDAACALRFQALYGEAPHGWRIAADADPLTPFLAAALPRQLLAQVEQAAAAQRLATLEIVPQFVAGYNRWRSQLAPGAWYALAHAGVLTLYAGGAVRALALPAGADHDWLAATLAREALRLNLEAPRQLAASGQLPPAWRSDALCMPLGLDADWSPAVRLAATGAAA